MKLIKPQFQNGDLLLKHMVPFMLLELTEKAKNYKEKNLGRFQSIFGSASQSSINFKTKFSERGIFKSLQLEFELQLKGVIEHYHRSDDLKFNARYVTDKLKQLFDVRISERQCRTYMTNIYKSQ